MCMGYAKEIQAWVCERERQQRDGFLLDWAGGLRLNEDATGTAMDESGIRTSLTQRDIAVGPPAKVGPSAQACSTQ